MGRLAVLFASGNLREEAMVDLEESVAAKAGR